MVKKIIYIHILISKILIAQNFLGCGTGLNNTAYGLYNDSTLNKLIVLGNFTIANGKLFKGIAIWDGQQFDSLGTGALPPLCYRKEPIINYKGKLYMQGGDYRLQSYDYNTKLWTQISGQFDNYIRDFTIFNNELIIVGDFFNVGSLSARNIVKFNGITFDTLPKLINTYRLYAVRSFNNELYVGGNFAGDTVFGATARFNGTKWLSMKNGLKGGAPPEVRSLEVYKEKLYIGGFWLTIDGKFNPSCIAWDGNNWIDLGTFIFQGGLPASITGFRIYKNKLYVFGGLDLIINKKKQNDTVKTYNMAVWNDTIWCGVKLKINSGAADVTNYNNQWYFAGNQTIYGDSIPFTQTSKVDTINYLGKYIGNNGKLERNCFDKIPVKLNSDGIYPNPFVNEIKFNFKSTFAKRCNLRVVNSLGQVIKTFVNIDSNGLLNLVDLPQGVYLFIFENDTTRKLVKLLKE
jgi:hypothetical protein